MRSTILCLVVTTPILAAGCVSIPEDACVWGESRGCGCDDGREGAQACPFEGLWGACSCDPFTDVGSECGGGAIARCDDRCVDVRTDPRHCGACNRLCPGECVDARCQGNGCTSVFDAVCAGIGCTDLTSDPFNCGDCGHECSAEQRCEESACIPIVCEFHICEHECVSDYHALHCGGVCGNACAPDERCNGTGCEPLGNTLSIYPDPLVGGIVRTEFWHACPPGPGGAQRVACRELGYRLSNPTSFAGQNADPHAAIRAIRSELGPQRHYICRSGLEDRLTDCDRQVDPVADCILDSGEMAGRVFSLLHCGD